MTARCPGCGQFGIAIAETVWCKGCPTVTVTVDGPFRDEEVSGEP